MEKAKRNFFDFDAKSGAVRLGNRQFSLPRSRMMRILLGAALILGGILGFLPVLGFWMLPLGILILSIEFHLVRRWRRRLVVWWRRRKGVRLE